MSVTALEHISLRGAVIVPPSNTSETASFAVQELSRYLYLLTGEESPLGDMLPATGTSVILVTDPIYAEQLGAPVTSRSVGDQGFHLHTYRFGKAEGVVIAALTPVGLLYGVYALLEEMGMGFYLGGETFPEPEDARLAAIPADLECIQKPAFSVRGNMLHYNFLCGCTDWGLEDYQFYFDQLARSRCNLLLMHWYDNEPGAAYEVDGEYISGGRAPNSLSRPWGALASLRTSQFSFGTGDFFDDEIFSTPVGQTAQDTLEEIKGFERLFSEATRYAERLGVRVAAGFEAHRGSPTDPEIERQFRARVTQFLQRNPHLTYFALWEHESGGSVGSALPEPDTPADELFRRQYDRFAYVGNPMRVWEAIRFGEYARIAYEVIQQVAPHLPMVLVGWGGDRWMHFAEYCLAYDKMFPRDVIFTCHDNIIAPIGPNVSTPWGQLPSERERWAMPWVECDLNDCWVRQPNVETLGLLAPDALQKGCQGLLTLQWRTRDVEEETGYIAQFSWNPTLTPEDFYHRFARHAFGPDQEAEMAERIATLQRLGARWTGVAGTPECTRMRWTGLVPHTPFTIDGQAAHMMRDIALKASDALAQIPEEELRQTEAGMFHMREGEELAASTRIDMNRPGAHEYEAAAQKLEELSRETDPDRLRQGMREIEEVIMQLRPSLIHAGVQTRCHIPMDEFWIRLHHLNRHGNVSEHFPVLERLHEELVDLRSRYLAQHRIHRLERLDHLLYTIGFVLPFDRAVMMLASGEMVDTALEQASRAHEAGDDEKATQIASDAYAQLLAAGMDDAVRALSRKLTNRCDFGVLTTINVKPLTLYWDTLGKLEDYLPAVPPREIRARADEAGVMLTWPSSPKSAGYHLYRQNTATGEITRANRNPLQPTTTMFLDRIEEPGAYDYTLTSLDEQGQESPHSHRSNTVDTHNEQPRIVASMPPATAEADYPIIVRTVVTGAHPIIAVRLHYRCASDDTWQTTEMLPRFRYSYHAAIPAEHVPPGILLYYVEALNTLGERTTWPPTAEDGRPWSVVVL